MPSNTELYDMLQEWSKDDKFDHDVKAWRGADSEVARWIKFHFIHEDS